MPVRVVVARYPGLRVGAWCWRAALLGRVNYVPIATGYCIECLGHDAPESAVEHYAQFLVESRTFFDRCEPKGCLLCGVQTEQAAYVYDETGQTQRQWPLCVEHRGKEHLVEVFAKLIEPIERFRG
jgi:hypothetical protein